MFDCAYVIGRERCLKEILEHLGINLEESL